MALCAGAPALAETVQFTATMAGTEEVPPVETSGHGTTEATYDTQTKTLTWTVEYSDLSGPATAAHFHGPAEPGSIADVSVPIPEPLDSPIKGSAELTDEQAADLMAGRLYANIHTAEHPDGEIRGQMTQAK